MSSSDGGLVLRTLVDANVQFVVVGEPGAAGALQIVVSRHPTNLEALGKALDTLQSSLRSPSELPAVGTSVPHRIGDPSGTVAVRTAGGDVDLVFGGTRRSLYADTLERAEERDIEGTRVHWSAAPAPLDAPGRVTSGALSRRLLSIAAGLAHLMDRPEGGAAPDEAGTGRDAEPTGGRPPAGSNRGAGGAESNAESGTAG